MYRKFKSSPDELDEFISFVESFLGNYNCSDICLHRILVSCEEMFLNICKYAYGIKMGEIGVDISAHDKVFEINILDSGIEFDPASYVGKNYHPGERIGGLGIFLAKKFMDKIEYRRENGKNNLIMCKKLEGDLNGKTV